jgi:ornithine cyclodeaminase/alanine dehydrogenase-like protein (mu-crystallin family)
MLLLNNDDVKSVLTMELTMEALEQAYADLFRQHAVCRPHVQIHIPTGDPAKTFRWGTMEGGSSPAGYFAIRMKSDIMYEQEYAGARTQEKYCVRPGLFCGLILLTSIHNGEPLALINDGHLQHMRVGADAGIGVKYMARQDAKVIGMLGSGGMARTFIEAIGLVRTIDKIQVYSPTPSHREAFARETSTRLGIEVVACDHPREAFLGADIIAGCTDSIDPVIPGGWLEKGMHIVNVAGGLDEEGLRRLDISLRFGTSPAPMGLPEFRIHDESVKYVALPERHGKLKRSHGVVGENKAVFLEDILSGRVLGRKSRDDITYSARGNLQGVQFFPVAGKVYELAKEKGIGKVIPTEWFLQDIRD